MVPNKVLQHKHIDIYSYRVKNVNAPIISNYPAFCRDSTYVRYIERRCRTKAWANHNAAAGTNATAGIRQNLSTR